ncbi:MAG TPA: FAD-dependent oxidoreductase [Humisphaera sp.]
MNRPSPTALPHIGIVGGGPGGLFTAYHVQKYVNRPVRITIIEASDRVGGKIHTPRFKSANVTYEAGAAEIYDYSGFDEDPLKELVAELGLSTTRMEGSAVVIDQRLVANVDDVRRHFGARCAEALLEFDRRAEGHQSPREFYLSDHAAAADAGMMRAGFQPFVDAIADPAARRYVQTMIHSDLATEPARTNLEYGLQNYLMNNPRYMRLYSIEGGNERIPQALADRFGGRVLLRHRAAAVGRADDGAMWADVEHDGAVRRETFDRLVLAMPNVALPGVRYEGEQLAAAIDRHLARYDHPAHYLRITILFDRPFWRGTFPDSYCMLDRFGGCCLYDESLRNPGCAHGVLGWLIAGENALEMSAWDDARLIEAALDSLPDFVPGGREHFVEGVVRRWVSAINAMPGGRAPVSLDRRHIPEPERHPNLFLVGDYLFDATLNGVLDSAEYVAGRIAAGLNQ